MCKGINAIPISPSEYETIILSLQAPSFEFEPKNEDIVPLTIKLQSVPSQRWVLFPKESASGHQAIIMNAWHDWRDTPFIYQLDLNVEKVKGIDPSSAGSLAFVFTAIGGFVTFFFSNINNYLSIKKMKKEMETKGKGKVKKTQNRRTEKRK